MGRYIMVRKSIPRSPKLSKAAEQLAPRVRLIIDGRELTEDEVRHALRHALLGVTVTLWSRGDELLQRDNSLPYSVTGLRQEVGCHAEFLSVLPKDWFGVRDDGSVELPGYVERNNLIPFEDRQAIVEKKRVQNRVRQRRKRAKDKVSRTSHARDENPSRTVTRDSHACHAPTGTETGNQKPVVTERDTSAGRRVPKVLAALQENARELARAGNNVDRIVRLLGEYQVTPTEVRDWIGDVTEHVA